MSILSALTRTVCDILLELVSRELRRQSLYINACLDRVVRV